jgi:hypothetical protein
MAASGSTIDPDYVGMLLSSKEPVTGKIGFILTRQLFSGWILG